MDLAMEDRIDTDLEKLIMVDPTPLGDDILDPVLADACGIFTELLSKREVRHALPRIELIRKMDLIGRAVTAAIWDIEVSLAKAIRPHMA